MAHFTNCSAAEWTSNAVHNGTAVQNRAFPSSILQSVFFQIWVKRRLYRNDHELLQYIQDTSRHHVIT